MTDGDTPQRLHDDQLGHAHHDYRQLVYVVELFHLRDCVSGAFHGY